MDLSCVCFGMMSLVGISCQLNCIYNEVQISEPVIPQCVVDLPLIQNEFWKEKNM